MRYQDENIWLTQKMMATLYDVSIAAINQHLKKIFEDGELPQDSVIKKYLITLPRCGDYCNRIPLGMLTVGDRLCSTERSIPPGMRTYGNTIL